MATVLIACERDAAGLACVLDRRVLFDAVSIGGERVTGVRAARTDHRTGTSRGRRTNAFVVVLDTAEGERDAGWSKEGNPAAVLTTALNNHIAAGTARFEESLRPHFTDRLLRLFGLFASLVGGASCRWPCGGGGNPRRPDLRRAAGDRLPARAIRRKLGVAQSGRLRVRGKDGVHTDSASPTSRHR